MLCRRSKLTALLCAFVLLVTLLIPSNAAAVTIGVQDTDVSNSASFSTDTIYQIVTDRFFDGDSSNNPTGDIFDITNPRKYHGGDWKGITQKINDGYLTGMGITAILLHYKFRNSVFVYIIERIFSININCVGTPRNRGKFRML